MAWPAFVADIDTETGRLYPGQKKEPEVNQEVTQMHITGMLFLIFVFSARIFRISG
ncbi:hypothetical protein NTGZN8_140035 [Candidatus Nitrotoga fabula]|uniref:Uncharacterized protein n=1 Tax=Candidatus Nitrotoga fabula TaxID=2182327 RepID=A0A916F937_9PROT|nr:hypothetical protein NTGZN8_140035 [Candidatus Nitrotoga fabula]